MNEGETRTGIKHGSADAIDLFRGKRPLRKNLQALASAGGDPAIERLTALLYEAMEREDAEDEEQ